MFANFVVAYSKQLSDQLRPPSQALSWSSFRMKSDQLISTVHSMAATLPIIIIVYPKVIPKAPLIEERKRQFRLTPFKQSASKANAKSESKEH